MHIPVLLDEVIEALSPESGKKYIDATLGDGGHFTALLESSSPNGRVLGLDQDRNQLIIAKEKAANYGERATLVQSRFSAIRAVAEAHGFESVDGILFDLGISSRQLDNPEYGLNLADDTLLDMRLSKESAMSAADFLNRANEVEIADTLYKYGDRRNSRYLARKIVGYRRKQAFQRAYDVKAALGIWRPNDLAPIFQALRIVINDEYGELEQALPQAVSLLAPGGKLAVISFHSGEDRIVKQFLKHCESVEVSKKIVTPTFNEMKKNSRARSAKLRIARKKTIL